MKNISENYYYSSFTLLHNLLLDLAKNTRQLDNFLRDSLIAQNNVQEELNTKVQSLQAEFKNNESKQMLGFLIHNIISLGNHIEKLYDLQKTNILTNTLNLLGVVNTLNSAIIKKDDTQKLKELLDIFFINNKELYPLSIEGFHEGDPVTFSAVVDLFKQGFILNDDNANEILTKDEKPDVAKLKPFYRFYNTKNDFLLSYTSMPILTDFEYFVSLNNPKLTSEVKQFTKFISMAKNQILQKLIIQDIDTLFYMHGDAHLLNYMNFIQKNTLSLPQIFNISNTHQIIYSPREIDLFDSVKYIDDLSAFIGIKDKIIEIDELQKGYNDLLKQRSVKYTAFDLVKGIEHLQKCKLGFYLNKVDATHSKLHISSMQLPSTETISGVNLNGLNSFIILDDRVIDNIFEFSSIFIEKYPTLKNVENLKNSGDIPDSVTAFINSVFQNTVVLNFLYTNNYISKLLSKIKGHYKESLFTVENVTDTANILSYSLVDNLIKLMQNFENKFKMESASTLITNNILNDVDQISQHLAEKYTKRVLSDTIKQLQNKDNDINDLDI
jgi:hypothetical protein